ncbi:uncharacterized protein DUF222 [Brevibacterium sanguinis]|uniref:Uncharacterized protein DUF222 n=2 Tax=Brevibacterium TaxID=1696 RepID=A0A366IK74_9MICO|nr:MULTISPECIES: HNH endonuclease signature motif containing protein [Brevibacterium]RBP64667.1 uncharacterized protein DUF222 [Brevibacterium sanguinis]RBP71690.1 uncharacterized protein DUF222 [Brevibacterium celere]
MDADVISADVPADETFGGAMFAGEIAEAVRSGPSDAGTPDGGDCSGDADRGEFRERSPADLSPDELVEDIRRTIGCIAHCHARVIALIDEVDRRDLWAQWVGVTSLANWVMHVAAVSPHTAREYVRVMTALREMPQVKESLVEGNVSYSKVREVTRLVGRIPDEDALRLAEHATGSQIGVVVRNYRQLSAADDSGELPRLLPRDSVTVRGTEPGRARVTVDLAEDEAAELVTMLEAARHTLEQHSDEDAEEPREQISQVQCLMEIVRAFPRAVPAGSMKADRARMLIHVSAETLVGPTASSPSAVGSSARPTTEAPGVTTVVASAQTTGAARTEASVEVKDVPEAAEVQDVPEAAAEVQDVPAGTPEPIEREHPAGPTGSRPDETDTTCRIDGFGGIGAATAQRLLCEALIAGVVKGGAGDVLALGRSKRLVSGRQRRALSARDIGCQFPGCRTRRRCDAHHIRPWSQGGTTDLDNLILLCRTHHTAVHEHGLTIRRTPAPFAGRLRGAPAFAFFTPAGAELLPLGDDWRARQVFDTARVVERAEAATLEADPSIRGGGWGFRLANCLAWMFEAEWRHARESEIAA